MKSKTRLVGCCALLLALLGLGPANAQVQAEDKALQARQHLEIRVNEVLEIIQDQDLASDPVALEQVLYDKAFEIFDFNTFSMLALGRKYRAFSPPQRQDFITYFSRLISNTYFPRLAGKDVSNIQIFYQGVRELKPKKGTFRTDITTELVQGETHVPVIYRMIRKEGREWKIYDVKIEGVSMAANYRAQFKQQVGQTPEEIIAQLKEKVEK